MRRPRRFHWLTAHFRSSRRPLRIGRSARRLLHCEPLEDRRLLAITVDTLVDEADGSIIDGDISLRDETASTKHTTSSANVAGLGNLPAKPAKAAKECPEKLTVCELLLCGHFWLGILRLRSGAA